MKEKANNSVKSIEYKGTTVHYVWFAESTGAYNDVIANAIQELHNIANNMNEPKFDSAYYTQLFEYNEYLVLYDRDKLDSIDGDELYNLINK